MKSITLSEDQYQEFENITSGVFAPLDGFMDELQFAHVVKDMSLPSGEVFTMPILLDIDSNCASSISGLERVPLEYKNNVVGYIRPLSIFTCDREDVSVKIFGTSDRRHPGVASFFQLKDLFVGGPVEINNRAPKASQSRSFTPEEVKVIFNERGWKKIVGFQTRNVPHRAHEYLLRIALETADGLFIQPLIGKKKLGDFTPQAIITGYTALISGFLPQDRVLFGTLSTRMRYAGPREAVFHALIRRNFGCTDFIIGRDQAGVGDWYGLYDAQELALKLEENLGIKIMALKGPFYCGKCDGIVTENSCPPDHLKYSEQISGTYMRQILKGGHIPSSHLMRSEVVQALKGTSCFIESEKD
jgi:sulfate adenylyltransferase